MGRVPHSSALAAKPAVQVGEDKKDADLMRRRQLKRGGFDEDSAGALQYAMQAPQLLCMDAGAVDVAAACATYGRRVALKVSPFPRCSTARPIR